MEGDIVVMTLSGKVMGGPDYEKFHGEIKGLIEQDHRKFLFDFSGVNWINSTGIGIIVAVYHSIKAAEGRMVICGANKRVRSIYYVSQLDKIFESFETRDEALAAIG
jgi:anti-sigma B factor antagonist